MFLTRPAPLLALALSACAAAPVPTPVPEPTCTPTEGDLPGAPLVRAGLDPAGVDAARARQIADEVAAAELRRTEAEQRKERPDFRISLDDYEVKAGEDVNGTEGCRIYNLFYHYRQPEGRELGPGHPSHFNVRVYQRDGRARLFYGR